ncbi:3-deoxy-D-manno-octulosonic acid transferase [Novispirillum itersonii]|uniref:3-deoxy-D-manno-octulosonic acid transferase n=1 Tax=Novispirillum itersonii TaxID=189 RepID=UPI0003749A53|nr:3-deoxy-D-manno-octulosonic acid transferase [Novispirillum itersonii]
MIGAAYRGLVMLGTPLLELWLRRRQAQGKEDPRRWRERRGFAGLSRPSGRVLWVHGASVGESLSILPLLSRLGQVCPGWAVVLTTGTVTSAALLADRLAADPALAHVCHQYVPVDHPLWVRRFLNHWRPDAALWLESELWPTLIHALGRRKVPLVLINGRMSERSFRRWQKTPGFARSLLAPFTLCLGQTEGDADRLRALGARQARCVGNIKMATPALPADPAALAALRTAIGGRPCWLAASTHAGEEAVAFAVHQALSAELPGLLTLIAPRHPQRAEEIIAALQGARLTRRAQAGAAATLPDAETGVYLADTMGELGVLYRLAPVSFIGKSLVGQGGQNPVEAARLGTAVVFGPHMQNFPELAPRLLACGGAISVADDTALTETVRGLLTDPALRQAVVSAGQAFATAEADVLDRVIAELLPVLREEVP